MILSVVTVLTTKCFKKCIEPAGKTTNWIDLEFRFFCVKLRQISFDNLQIFSQKSYWTLFQKVMKRFKVLISKFLQNLEKMR